MGRSRLDFRLIQHCFWQHIANKKARKKTQQCTDKRVRVLTCRSPAFCFSFFRRGPMLSWVDLAAAITAADPAGLLADSDVSLVVASVQAHLQTWAFTWHGGCPGCGHVPPLIPAKQCKSLILDVDGIHRAKHTPRRCRRRECRDHGLYLWHNFQVHDRKVLRWKHAAKGLPSVILLTQRFGVTRRWYEQFSTRLVVQMSSFWGEAKVHWQPGFGLSFNRFKLKLEDAWFKIRLLVRHWQLKPHVCLCWSGNKEDIIRQFNQDYDSLMVKLRTAQVAGAGEPLLGVVIDGHVKAGARRRCGVPWVATSWCQPLRAWCLTTCPKTPASKQKICSWHARCLAAHDEAPGTFQSVARNVSLSQDSDDLLRLLVREDGRTESASKNLSDLTPEQNILLQGHLTAAHRAKGSSRAEPLLHDGTTLQEILDLSCKTHKEADAAMKSSRAGGVLVACRSDGLIVHVQEYRGAESLSQRYCFLAHIKDMHSSVRVTVHDDACHLRRFAANRSSAAINSLPIGVYQLALPNSNLSRQRVLMTLSGSVSRVLLVVRSSLESFGRIVGLPGHAVRD